jgi:restriction system protein
MSKFQSVVDRAMLAFVSRISGWEALAIAVALYGGIGLAMPLGLSMPTYGLVYFNAFGTVVAAVILLGWLLVRIAAGERRNLLEWTTDLRRLNFKEFEWLVGEVFRREGWIVRETGRDDGPDGNIDLELLQGGQRKIVQCKRWTAQSVGVDEIRRFLGTLMREKLPGGSGIFVTLSDFTDQARREALQSGIVLVDNRELFSLIEKVRRAEPCSTCGAPMILGKSQYGWWFRCKEKGCTGKRDLGADAGRAVDLLFQRAD